MNLFSMQCAVLSRPTAEPTAEPGTDVKLRVRIHQGFVDITLARYQCQQLSKHILRSLKVAIALELGPMGGNSFVVIADN